jgi:hypothetical protein
MGSYAGLVEELPNGGVIGFPVAAIKRCNILKAALSRPSR